jgi:hypothetical protein
MSAGRRRQQILRFVVTKEEAKKIREAAEKRGMTVSEYLRQVSIPKD